MRITIELDTTTATDSELARLIAFLKAGSQQPAGEAGEDSEDSLLTLTEQQIFDRVSQMLATAIAGQGGVIIKVPDLYEVTTQERWNDLDPTTRKAIGRRFRQVANADAERKKAGGGKDPFGDDEVWVEFKERNPQNMAIYALNHPPKHLSDMPSNL